MRVKLILFVKSLVNYFNSISLPKMILVNIEIDLMKPLGNFKNEVYTENFKSNLKYLVWNTFDITYWTSILFTIFRIDTNLW